MFCGNCGNELKPGARFCPSCGSAVKPVQARTDESTWASAPADQPEAEAGSTAAAPVMTKTKRQWTGKRKTMAVAGVVLILIALFATLGGSGGGYADGLVEADNAYGLSTTMDLEEFVSYYNTFLIETLEIETDFEFSLQCIEIEEPYTITQYDELDLTEYTYSYSGGEIQPSVHIVVDNETDYVVSAILMFRADGYNSILVNDSARDAVDAKAYALFFALCEGDIDRADTIVAHHQNDNFYTWEDGITDINSVYKDGVAHIGFYTMTEDAFAQWAAEQ